MVWFDVRCDLLKVIWTARPQHDLTDDFTSVEGWTVPALKWNGVALETILSLAVATAEARWIQASAGAFSVPLATEEAGRALLATHLGGQLLPVEHGGPGRLVVPGADCLTSVWLRASPASDAINSTLSFPNCLPAASRLSRSLAVIAMRAPSLRNSRAVSSPIPLVDR
jgi:Oxidoreductase molybdopterin binding domain